MMKTQLKDPPKNITVQHNGIEYYTEFEIENIEIQNAGIGEYEFWGSVGFDRGEDYVEDFDVSLLKAEVFDEEQNKYFPVKYDVFLKLRLEQEIKEKLRNIYDFELEDVYV